MPLRNGVRLAAPLALLLGGSVGAQAAVDRVVILKVDGLPQRLIEEYTQAASSSQRAMLPNLARIFMHDGVVLDNFYTRGLSLSAPSWSLLDTGRPLEIRGNVEYDRYTLRAWDYLNFFPFYVGYALSRRVDMPGVERLDAEGVPLLIDRFPYEQRYQSFQLLQRGIRWSTLESSLKDPFRSRSLRGLFDEWQTGFSLSSSVAQATERDLLAKLNDPQVRYLDYFSGEFDHVAHLTPDSVSQLHVLESLDALTGRLWAAIQKSPLADTTVLALVSDHGMNTGEHIYSQGYSLVEWFNSAAGGAHHVITDRHPLTEFKLKGLNPFVSEVVTPSSEAGYLAGRSAEYPTVVLDPDGNERANIGLRNNALNRMQILLEQILQKGLKGAVRTAAIEALMREIEARRPAWEPQLERIEAGVSALHQHIEEQRKIVAAAPAKWTKAGRDRGLDKDARRALERLETWKEQERADSAYVTTMRRLLALTAADFDPGKFKVEQLIPRKSLGELNTIHDLRHYVTGIEPGGFVLEADGTLDNEHSFSTVDYFAALTGITTRNQVQKAVGLRPVDFVAAPVDAAALRASLGSDERVDGGIWLFAGPNREALILTRHDAVGKLELRYLPVSQFRQDAGGAIQFERCAWTAGLPLALWEDEALETGEDKADWLEKWHGERDWLAAIHRTRYSNGLIGLTEQLLGSPSLSRDRLRTDLLVFAADHWNFNVRGFNPGGNHGSLLRASTHSVWMMAGGKDTGILKGLHIATSYDSLSFVPTILSLMGMPEPDLPGPVVYELSGK